MTGFMRRILLQMSQLLSLVQRERTILRHMLVGMMRLPLPSSMSPELHKPKRIVLNQTQKAPERMPMMRFLLRMSKEIRVCRLERVLKLSRRLSKVRSSMLFRVSFGHSSLF